MSKKNLQPRILVLSLAMLAAAGLAAAPAAAAGSVSVDLHLDLGASGSGQGSLSVDRLYLSLVRASARRYFGFDAFSSCAGYYQRPSELIPALYLAAETGWAPAAILKGKKAKGWGRLAKDLGLPKQYWAKGRGHGRRGDQEYPADRDFEQSLYLYYLSGYYGTDRRQLSLWEQKGIGQADLILGLNLAARSGRPAASLWSWRLQGLSWTVIAVRAGQRPAALSVAVAPRAGYRRWPGLEDGD